MAAHQKGAVKKRAWIVFLDESGVSPLPQIRRTYAPRGRTPLLRHRLNWKRASMAGALGYHSTDPERGARLCFHLKPGSYDTTGLIEVLEQMKVFYRGEQVVLVWDGLSAHWSRAMRAWAAEQDWLALERLPAYAPEPNPVELLWSSLKKRELANLVGDHLADVAEQGIHRINHNPPLPGSFLSNAHWPLADRSSTRFGLARPRAPCRVCIWRQARPQGRDLPLPAASRDAAQRGGRAMWSSTSSVSRSPIGIDRPGRRCRSGITVRHLVPSAARF
ncbi:transposase [Streptomyces sp. DSM 41014]|uniref:Transposase n=1 Tax=Streptomyces hintoniae TaxID=3075521 RepID=A0ABU2UCT0_9ACTN|nr:transposase [Streptomyces sp. DSM 41014]MDT0471065.1 transposase [Streptomyces sp. DSM 41014]